MGEGEVDNCGGTFSLSVVTLCIYLTGSVFSSNYTVPRHPRVAAGTADARDAANLFSPSLEISDDVRALLPLVLLRAKFVPLRVRESQGRFIKARISRAPRSIFLRSFIHRPCTRGRAPRRKFVVGPKTKSERPEAP